MKRTQRRPGLVVTTGGRGVVAHAGARLLCDLADRLGLTDSLSAALAPTKRWRPGHVALGLQPREAVFDAGFGPAPTAATMATVGPDIQLFVVGSKANGGSRRTLRRRARYRVGCEGRIAHLKRDYRAGRSRLKGESGTRIWEAWAVFGYDVDTAAALAVGTGSTRGVPHAITAGNRKRKRKNGERASHRRSPMIGDLSLASVYPGEVV